MDPLLKACRTGGYDSVKDILLGNVEDLDLENALCTAILNEQVCIVDLLLDLGVPISSKPLSYAMHIMSRDMFQCFLDHGWNINTVEQGPVLIHAVYKPSILEWLLDEGADPNLKSLGRGAGRPCSPMQSALATNQIPAMRVLLAHGAFLEDALWDDCVLKTADREIPPRTLQFLLDSGLNPNVVVERGNGTPLQLAARRGMVAKAKVLLLGGANPKVKNRKGQTPLDEARQEGNKAMIKLLEAHSNQDE